jgi:hypothetical protein
MRVSKKLLINEIFKEIQYGAIVLAYAILLSALNER